MSNPKKKSSIPLLFLAIFGMSFLPIHAQGKVFSNKFVEFQLPAKWSCILNGGEWVCQSTDEQKKREAIIVLAAKIRKVGEDELAVYKAKLEVNRTNKTPSGQKYKSKRRYVKSRTIAGKEWVDALHFQSEIPGFFTRYLGTIESDLGILVTFSVRKDKYKEYLADIEGMIQSLRAFRKPGDINVDPNSISDLDLDLEEDDADLFPDEASCPKGYKRHPKTGQCAKLRKQQGDDDLFTLLLIGGAALVAFIIWRKKRQQG